MTIATSLAPARSESFHTTQAAQQQQHGKHVQFSLPPVQGTGPAGGSTPPKARGGVTLLPIATPASAPGTATTAQSLASTQPHSTAPLNQGNVVSARMISRLYQGKL